MNHQIDDLTLIKFLRKGSFGEVYLSIKKGKNQYFATKKIDRKIADGPTFKKYFENEINLLKLFNHPNIVKLEEIKASVNHYYIIMEYINGGTLSDCLKKYMEKYKKAFPEEIVQYLMIQIIEGLCYLHKQKIIHRDLKLDNIMINFDTVQDIQNLNMMKAKIKIIDFDLATKISADKNGLTYTIVGVPKNMDPIILNKMAKRKYKNLGYDQKADIWSIGTVCYELLLGKSAFDAKTLDELINQVEKGYFNLPQNISKEVVSFINSMLQYDSKVRLSAEELRKHPFLTRHVSQFTKIDTVKTTKQSKSFKKRSTIWSIFKNEEQFTNIKEDITQISGKETNYINNGTIKINKEQGIKCSEFKNYTDNQLGLGLNSNNTDKIKKEQGVTESKTYTDNQLDVYSNNNNIYTDNQLGYNKPKNNPNINFVNNNFNNNNNENYHRSHTTKNIPVFNFNTNNMNKTPQISQSGPPLSPMINFQVQQQQIKQNPTFVVPQNYGAFYQQNITSQTNFHKTLTYKGDSNQLFKGIK